MQNVTFKGILQGIITVAGNGAIFALIPEPFKNWAILAFNVILVVYNFLDPSFAVHLMQIGKMDSLGRRIGK